MARRGCVLVAGGDATLAARLRPEPPGPYDLAVAASLDEAITLCRSRPVDVLVLPVGRLLPKGTLPLTLREDPTASGLQVLALTESGSRPEIMGAIRAGASDCCPASADGRILRLKVSKLLARRLRKEGTATLSTGSAPPRPPNPEEASIEEGGQIAHYEIRAVIDRGGMGTVYWAFDPNLQRDVALKILHRRRGAEPDLVGRLRTEALALARLRHPNIVPVYDVGQHEGLPYLVMGLIPGGTVADRVGAQGPVPPRIGFEWIVQALRGLAAAHAVGVVHRDVKPGNLVIDPTPTAEEIRLVDFGLATRWGEANDTAGGLRAIGTPAYMSPEQCRGEEATAASDLYGLGCTAYFLLTGAPPFPGDAPDTVMRAHLSASPRRPEVLSDEQWALVERLLRKAPAERFASAAEAEREAARILASVRALPRLLVVDDEPAFLEILRFRLERAGYPVLTATSGPEALEILRREECDVALLDIGLPGLGGVETLRRIRQGTSLAEVVLMTAHATVDTAVEATRYGACDYVEKTVGLAALREVIARAHQRKLANIRSASLRLLVDQSSFFPDVIGSSAAIRTAVAEIQAAARDDAPVILLGPAGSGKDLAAKLIHRGSRRSAAPLLSLDCARVAPARLESELFGQEEGEAASPTVSRGILELADGGTLFLESIDALESRTQEDLLHALSAGEIARRRSGTRVRVEVRLIAATSLPPDAPGCEILPLLRERLGAREIRMPSLAERREDIPSLARYFLDRLSGGRIREIAPEAMRALEAYAWPGNVSELRNVVERAVILAERDRLEARHLPLGPPVAGGVAVSAGLTLREMERRYILETIASCGGDRRRAAERLGLSLEALDLRLGTA